MHFISFVLIYSLWLLRLRQRANVFFREGHPRRYTVTLRLTSIFLLSFFNKNMFLLSSQDFPESTTNFSEVRAFHKLLGNFLATSRISSNFFCFEQLFAFWAISSFLPILRNRSSFRRQFMNFLWKRSQFLPPGQIMGARRMQPGCQVSGFFLKENSKWQTKVHIRRTRVSQVKKFIQILWG